MQRAPERVVRRILRAQGQQAWVELALRYGRSFRFSTMVATCEPAAVQALLMDRAHAEVRPKVLRIMAKLPGADGILFMDGEPWLTRTRAVMPVFHQRNVDSYAGSLREATLVHIARWEAQGRVPDLADAVQQLGAASVLRMGYGLDPDDPLAARLGRALVAYKQFTMRPEPRGRIDDVAAGPEKILALPWIIGTIVGMARLTRDVRGAVRAILRDARTPGDRPDWITRLQQAGLPEDALALEINHFYGAFNAIDYVLTAALNELARDHALAATLREEIAGALGDREPAEHGDLLRLPRTHAFMLEVFRRYPVSTSVVRRTGKPIELGGETLPAGTQVAILLHALHHHPDFWDEPGRLKPERWLPSLAPRVPYSYVPFLDGSRKCIGRGMAEMHMLVVLTTIIRRFDLRVFADAIVPRYSIPRFAAPIPFSLQSPASLAG